jgi:uncharacterized protein involved in exopolysaccharide biosynthesis
MVAAAAAVFVPRPTYRADARLRLGDPPPTAGVSPTGGLLSFLRTGGDPFANDLEVLGSRTLASGVVMGQALSVRVLAPRGWYRDSLMVSLTLQDTTAKALYEARWTSPDRVQVRQLSPMDREEGDFRAGEAALFGGMRVVFARQKTGAPPQVRLKTIPFGDAVRSATSNIAVTRTRRDANVLEISYTHNDPGVALGVVRDAVEDFLRLRTNLFQRESGETVDSLRAVSRGTLEELRAAEDSMESYQRATGLVALEPQSSALVERYEAARTALEQARAEREALDAQMSRVADVSDPVEAWSVLVAHPRFLENANVGDFLRRLTELQEQRNVSATRLQPSSLELSTLDAQIGQLDQALRALVEEYRTSLSQGIGELSDRVTEMEALIETLPAKLVELGRRQRDVHLLSELVVLTEQRLRQEELRQALAFSNVQVIDQPGLRFRPVWPRKKLGLAVGLVLAVAAGTLGMATVERADTSLRSASRIRELSNGPVLSAPVSSGGTSSASPEEQAAVRGVLEGGAIVICRGLTSAEAAAVDPRGPDAELGGPILIRGYADAAAAAARGRQAVVAVRVGRTTEADLMSVCTLLREVGVTVAGTVAVCGSPGEATELWG